MVLATERHRTIVVAQTDLAPLSAREIKAPHDVNVTRRMDILEIGKN